MPQNLKFAFLQSLLAYHVLAQTAPIWNYSAGGLDWADATNSCGGKAQSPISLDGVVLQKLDESYFEFELANAVLTTQLKIDKNIVVNGTFSVMRLRDDSGQVAEYECVEIHIHAPSEHYINGRLYDAEIHFKHHIKPEFKSLEGFRAAAVVAIFMEAKENEESVFIRQLNIDTANSTRTVDLEAAFSGFLKGVDRFLAYDGSLTTPPCAEVVRWVVLTKPMPISLRQLTAIDKKFRGNRKFATGRGNNRLIQPLNGRVVIEAPFVVKIQSNLVESAFFAVFLDKVFTGKNISAAVKTLGLVMKSGEYRSQSDLATALARTGHIEAALQIAADISEEEWRSLAQSGIAAAQASAEDQVQS